LQAEDISFVHHPLNAYSLLRHVAVGWQVLEAGLKGELARRGGSGGSRLLRVLQRRETRHVPDEPDVDGVAKGIARYRNG
jgi:Prolyl 4-Hydroxylase alpha-subunit, N-terminal region